VPAPWSAAQRCNGHCGSRKINWPHSTVQHRSECAAQYRTHGTAAVGDWFGPFVAAGLSIVALQQCSAPQQQRCGKESRTACVGLCAEGTKDGVHVDVTFYKPFSKAPLVFTTIQGSADGHQFATVGPQRFVKSTIGTRHPPPAASSPPLRRCG
jgi:hypothetical protein